MIRSLGYLRIESADVGAWREFGVKVLGLTEGRGPEDGALYLRMDDFPARLVILPGPSERLLASGWEVADAAALAAVGRALADAGVAYKPGTDGECAARRVGSLLHVDDPAGHTLEVFCGAALESPAGGQPVREPLRHRRPGDGSRGAAGAARLGGGVRVLHRGPRVPAAGFDADAGRVLRGRGGGPAGRGSGSWAATRGTTAWPWRRCPRRR